MEIEQLKEEALKSVDKMVTTKAKAQAIAFLRDTLLPAVKQFADVLAQALKNSATSKTVWCYFRDAYLSLASSKLPAGASASSSTVWARRRRKKQPQRRARRRRPNRKEVTLRQRSRGRLNAKEGA